MSLQEHVRTVQEIAHQAASCSESEHPLLLLRLYPIVSSSKLSLKEMKEVKRQVWLNDILHILVEVLRQDFSALKGSWTTAQQLAFVLSSVCSGLHPRSISGVNTEQKMEFYDILLPTVVDSILILATNMLEAITNGSCRTEDAFTSVLDSLLLVCKHHASVVIRVLQSPYLLHMLITDNEELAHDILRALETLLSVDLYSLLKLPTQAFHSILDELVYKISGSDERNALHSLDTLATISSLDVHTLQLILSRYTNLQALVAMWGFTELAEGTNLFLHHVETMSRTTHASSERQAAVVIQACWKGYSTRKKMKRIHNGIRRFQQFYRKWKSEKVAKRSVEMTTKQAQTGKQEKLKQERIAFLENQLTLVQQLPSGNVASFITKQEEKAATKIQSSWRVYRAKKQFSHIQQNAHLSRSATVIQKAFREYNTKKKAQQSVGASIHWKIDEKDRASLQKEINDFRDNRVPKFTSEVETRQLHEQVQGMLEQFYVSRQSEARKSNQQKLLLSQLERSNSLLTSAPSLEESFSMQDISRTFSSGSSHIASMAQIAHKEELKCTDLPWWKRPHSFD